MVAMGVRRRSAAGWPSARASRYPRAVGLPSIRAAAAFVLASLGLAGCRAPALASPEERVAPPEPRPEVPSEGFVVLPWGTQVYLEPRTGAASARLGWPAAAPPPWPSPGYVARVVGWRDGFVEISPILENRERHCGAVLEGEVFDVRLYVSPWALTPLLTRVVDTAHEDGSTLSLNPGALAQPIPDDAEGRWAVSAGGVRVRTVLPDDAVGLAYLPAAPISAPSQGSWQMPEGRPFSYEGWPLELDPNLGYQVSIVSVVSHSESYRVELVSPCARVVAVAAQEPPSWQPEVFFEFGLGAPEPVPEELIDEIIGPLDFDAIGELRSGSMESGQLGGIFTGAVFTGGVRPERVFEAGAPLYLSAAGPVAGTLAHMRVFSEDAWAAGDRICFHTSFGAHFEPPLAVCLPAAEARVRNPAVDVHDFGGATVLPGAIQITGALAEPAVASALRRHRSDLRRCWGEALGQGAQAGSELELALDVNGEGAVTHVRLRSPWIASFTDCAVASAQQWTMPAPEDGKPAKVVFSVSLARR